MMGGTGIRHCYLFFRMNSIEALHSTDDIPPERVGIVRPRLSKDAINSLPLFHYEGKISVVRSKDDLAAAVARLSKERVLGFDTETPPSFRKGKTHSPTLVQLAGANEVVLFPLKIVPLGSDLISLFESRDILKSGVAVHDDMRFLAKLVSFTPQAVVDLSEVARRNRIENRGLRGLAAALLGLRISKGEQCSNWGNCELSPRQIRYAATDAWASRAVYLHMREAGLDMDVSAPPPMRSKKASSRPPRPRRRVKRPPPKTS